MGIIIAKSVVSCPLNKLFGSTQDPTNHITESVNLGLLNIKFLDLSLDPIRGCRGENIFNLILSIGISPEDFY